MRAVVQRRRQKLVLTFIFYVVLQMSLLPILQLSIFTLSELLLPLLHNTAIIGSTCCTQYFFHNTTTARLKTTTLLIPIQFNKVNICYYMYNMYKNTHYVKHTYTEIHVSRNRQTFIPIVTQQHQWGNSNQCTFNTMKV